MTTLKPIATRTTERLSEKEPRSPTYKQGGNMAVTLPGPQNGTTKQGGLRKLLSMPSDMSPVSVQLAILTGFAAIVGLSLLAIYAWQERDPSIFAVGALTAQAITAVAAAGGFLFGLPRYSSVLAVPVPSSESSAESSVAVAAEAQVTAGAFTPSSNLEQISDWVTKLILGAGLVQLGHVGRWLGDFISRLAVGLTGSDTQAASPTARIVAGSLLAFYTAYGFLFGYIVTVLWFQRRLQTALERSSALRSQGPSGHLDST